MWPCVCRFLLYIISKSILMELAYFCSVDQHLMLFKHVENREEIWGYMYMYMYMGIYVYI